MLERYYNMKVCILHTDLKEFNFNAATKYFSHTGITWEPLALYTQEQNEIVECPMQTVVKDVQSINA